MNTMLWILNAGLYLLFNPLAAAAAAAIASALEHSDSQKMNVVRKRWHYVAPRNSISIRT